MSPGEALRFLISNTYLNYLADTTARVREFEMLSRLLRHVRIRRLVFPADWPCAGDTCELVLRDVSEKRRALSAPETTVVAGTR
jgi:hypothetical protein